MLYEVDFSVKVSDSFCTIHTAFVLACSVSECMAKAQEIKESLEPRHGNQIFISIEA